MFHAGGAKNKSLETSLQASLALAAGGGLLVQHLVMGPRAEVLEGAKSLQRRVHHVDDLANIVEVLADRAIRQAESADAHLVSDLLPIVQIGLQANREPGGVAGKLEAATVGGYELALGRLVVAELNHMVIVLGVPGRIDLVDGLLGDASLIVLLEDKAICSVANHDFKLRVELSLNHGVQGGGKGGG